MELKITTLEGSAAGSVNLSDAIFGLEPRADIIQRCVNWQLAKRQLTWFRNQMKDWPWASAEEAEKVLEGQISVLSPTNLQA